MPPAEVHIDTTLVRRLLGEQHPDLRDLDLIDMGEGWDNRVFLLGNALSVRVPRRAIAAPLIAKEQRWLPQIGPRLRLDVPSPVRVGRPRQRRTQTLGRRTVEVALQDG